MKNAESMDGLRGLKSVSESKSSVVGEGKARYLDPDRIAFLLGTIWGATFALIGIFFWIKVKS